MASIHGWFRVKLTPSKLILRSPLYFWPEHWLDSVGRSARCMGPGCVLCELYPPRSMGCVAVQEFESPRVWLLKLPAGDGDLMAQLDALQELTVGQVVSVVAVSKQPADGIELKLHGHIVTKAVPCSRYVSAIGVKQYAQALTKLGLDLLPNMIDNSS